MTLLIVWLVVWLCFHAPALHGAWLVSLLVLIVLALADGVRRG